MANGQLLRLSVNTTTAGANFSQLLSLKASVPVVQASGQLLRLSASITAVGAARGQLVRLEVTTPTQTNAGLDVFNVEPYTTVTLTGVDEEWAGAVRSWVQLSGAPTLVVQGGKTATFRAPGTMVGSDLVFEYRVAGALPDQVKIRVQRATEFLAVGGILGPCRMLRASA